MWGGWGGGEEGKRLPETVHSEESRGRADLPEKGFVNAFALIPFSLIFMSFTFSLALSRFRPPPPAAQRVFPLHPISLLFFRCFSPCNSPCGPSHNKESPESPRQRQNHNISFGNCHCFSLDIFATDLIPNPVGRQC